MFVSLLFSDPIEPTESIPLFGQPGFHAVLPQRLLSHPKLRQILCAGEHRGVVAQLDDEPRIRIQPAQRTEQRDPGHGTLARRPMPVGISIGVLKMDVRQHVARGIDEALDRRRTGRTVRVKGMPGIE